MVKISVVIVNYESSKDTLECITTLMKSKAALKCEVIVVDNSIKDKLSILLKRKFPKVKYIKSIKNIGYGAGNNLGVKYASGKYILFLNPDTRVLPDTLKVLSEFLDKNIKAAGLSPVLTDEKGVIFTQIGSKELTPLKAIFSLTFINKIFPNNPISKKYFLQGVPTKKACEADAIPGSAFMIRKDIFEKAGKFDENIFLYFEESDLGKRIKSLGYKLYITPKTKVLHKWKVDKSNSLLQKIFNKSRFYYFKKHFGILPALIVELFCRISLYDIIFLLIFALGVFIRFYKIDSVFNFDSETADNLLVMKNAVNKGSIPLVGPPTSHPWLYFAPLFYWFYIPLMLITNYQPLAHYITGITVNIFGIILYYFVIAKLWNKKLAVVTSIFLTFSPFLLIFSQSARFYTYIFPVSAIILYLLFKTITNGKYLFWLFFSLGVSLSFHYTPLAFIPGILLILNKRIFNKYSLRSAIFGFLIPLVPLLIFDIKNSFSMTTKLLMWIPYKILSFLNILNISNHKYSFSDSVQSLFNFNNLLYGFYNDYPVTTMILLLGVLILLLLYLKRSDKNIKNTAIFVGIYLFLLLLHGDAPLHYYLAISPFIFIVLSDFIINLYKKSGIAIKIAVLILLCLFILKNISNQINKINALDNTANYHEGYMPYTVMNKITEFIVRDSGRRRFSLNRIGINDQFIGNFAQNYQYLMWLNGNEPVKVGDVIIDKEESPMEYLIVENNKYITENDYTYLYSNGNVSVYKKLNE